MEKRTKKARVIPLLLCAFILCINFKARAESLPQLFEGTATLADVIMSMYAMSGVGVANQTWINQLYASYGDSFGTIQDLVSQGALVMNEVSQYIPTQSLEEAISQASAYTELGIGQMFNISAEEATATGAVAATGASTLAGALGGVASTGVIPLLGAVTVAYWGGIAIGTLINHLIDRYGRAIFAGVPITSEKVLNSLPANTSPVYSKIQSSTYGNYKYLWYVAGGSMYWADLRYSNSYALIYYNVTSGNALRYYRESPSGLISTGTSNSSILATDGVGYSTFPYDQRPEAEPISYVFTTSQDFQDFLVGLRNGTIEPSKKSNDMIGENGNQTGTYDSQTGKYAVPDMKPQIDPGVEAGKPLRMQDWLNFANGVKNNNSNISPDSNPVGNNKNLFLGMIDNLKTVSPNPDPDPYAPPNPTPVPDPDYGDPNPDQPEWESETGDVPDPVTTGNPWVLPDITDKFPFCIPKDLKTMAENFKSTNRQAPHISWRFNPPHIPVDYTFNLDLSDFEEAAELLRSLELIGFVVGLAVATRYLIGAT